MTIPAVSRTPILSGWGSIAPPLRVTWVLWTVLFAARIYAQGGCPNVAGAWTLDERATLACTVTVAGQTDRYSDPLKASRTVTIAQTSGSCNFSYDPGTIGAGTVVQYARGGVTGVLKGNSVTATGGQLLPAPGTQLTESTYSATGQVNGNDMTLSGSGPVRGTQVVENGLIATLNCTLTKTANFSRVVQPPGPSVTELTTVPFPPLASQQFAISISGSNFNPANVQILFTGPGCSPCIVSNAVLTTKTAMLVTGPLTLNTAGVYVVSVQNGPGGPVSDGLPLTLGTPPPPTSIEWTRQFGTAGNDGAWAVAADSTGVYTVGSVAGSLPGQTATAGAFVRKHDRDGNELWTRQFGQPSSAYAAAVDRSGFYVGGSATSALPGQTSVGSSDAYIRKYDVAGTEIWTRQFGSSGSSTINGIATDEVSIYVVGYVTGALTGQSSSGAEDAFVRKYDASGTEQWTRQFGTAGLDIADGVAVDATGVYVAGLAGGALPGQSSAGAGDAFVRKYDLKGALLWTRQFGTSGTDRAFEVVTNASGVYVVGHLNGASPVSFEGENAFVRRYDANGVLLWSREFGTIGLDSARAAAVDSTGIYVAGHVAGVLPGQVSAGNIDGYVRKYDAGGNVLWTRQFGGSRIDYVDGLALDSTGLYLAGQTLVPVPGQTITVTFDAFTMKLSDGATPHPPPEVNDGGVINNASFVAGSRSVAPGSIAAVFGKDLNLGSTVPFSSFGADGKLVTSLGGSSVAINNIPAPLLYSTSGQLGIQIPVELAGQSSATIQVVVGAQVSAPRIIFLEDFAPGLFTLSQDGRGAVAALHQDGVTPVTADNPAKPEEVISLYGTGLGVLIPPLATGARSGTNRTATPAVITIDGTVAEVLYSGVAPGFVGLNQINVRIPAGARSDPNVPLVLSIGGKQGNTVTLPVAR